MIGKAKSNKSLAATIAYNEREKAELIYANKLEGISLNDYRMQMEDLQKCYTGYGRQLTIHAILSPAIEDGKALSMEQWRKIADNYLVKMNMQDLQAIGFLHTDKEHRHLHLVINKVKEADFKLFHDGYIGKKSQKIADEIAREMKLVRAMEIKQARMANKLRKEEALTIRIHIPEGKPVGAKQQFKAILDKLIKNSYASAAEYFIALEAAGFTVHPYTNKETGELRGYGIEMNGTKMDASAISKKFTLKALGIAGNRDSELNPGIKREESLDKYPETITPLTDIRKMAVLENYARAMGITKEILVACNDIKMLEQNEKYFLAMKNDSGGYSMINPFSIAQYGQNDITTKFTGSEPPLVVVEDIFDYLRHKKQNPVRAFNYIILHSVKNIQKAIKKIAALRLAKVILLLKDDVIGKFIATEIKKGLKVLLAKNKRLIAGESQIKDADSSYMKLNENINNKPKGKRSKL